MAPRETLQNTAQSVVDGFNSWTEHGVLHWRTEDCKLQILPASLGIEERDNKGSMENFRVIQPYYNNFRLTLLSTTIDTVANQVVMFLRSSAETVAGPYRNEYVVRIWTTADGKKVKRLEEFVDSLGGATTAAKVEKIARAERKKAGKGYDNVTGGSVQQEEKQTGERSKIKL